MCPKLCGRYCSIPLLLFIQILTIRSLISAAPRDNILIVQRFVSDQLALPFQLNCRIRRVQRVHYTGVVRNGKKQICNRQTSYFFSSEASGTL